MKSYTKYRKEKCKKSAKRSCNFLMCENIVMRYTYEVHVCVLVSVLDEILAYYNRPILWFVIQFDCTSIIFNIYVAIFQENTSTLSEAWLHEAIRLLAFCVTYIIYVLTARCYAERGYCLSVRLPVTFMYPACSHRLEYFENNFTAD